jgi:two-component system CheB/CheR fusion protein
MAYVVVQHLDPNRQGMLVELLQRHCALPVVEAKDQMEVEPNHVYVIPSGPRPLRFGQCPAFV